MIVENMAKFCQVLPEDALLHMSTPRLKHYRDYNASLSADGAWQASAPRAPHPV